MKLNNFCIKVNKDLKICMYIYNIAINVFLKDALYKLFMGVSINKVFIHSF